jgi:acyl-CoA synthetase (AMP-forming)/AMP-acid ligase II
VPLSRIDAEEILARALTEEGQGMCVGRPLPGVSLAIIKITDEPLARFSPELLLPPGEIGEIIARGPMVSPGYFERPGDTAGSIIPEPPGSFWRRMGDVGWLDTEGRLWFCGRKAHRVVTGRGVLFSIPCEAVFNNHPQVRRSALVGVGPPGDRKPVIIVEPRSRLAGSAWPRLAAELAALARANPRTLDIETFLPHPAFPVDPRHNAKINREALAAWAEGELRGL